MQSQRGFSLVELLVALLVLTIVITTTLAVFTERRARLQQAAEIVLAYQVLSNEAEAQRRIPFDAIMPASAFSTSTELLAPLVPFTTKIAVASTKGGVKDVTMSISWRGGKRQAKLLLERVDTGGGSLW